MSSTEPLTSTESLTSTEPTTITPTLLREWALPTPGGSKQARGQIVVIGGALRSPGAAMLAAMAALRAGGGRMTLALAASVAAHAAVALPECGVVPLRETAEGHIAGESVVLAEADLTGADAILVGPGLDDADETVALLKALPALIPDGAVVLLDAFALGVLSQVPELYEPLAGRLILTPNTAEAHRLLGRETELTADVVAEIAERYGAAVSCQDFVCDPEGNRWVAGTGAPGLGTSGSGDVLAGVAAGLAGRGATPAQAAVWATHLHATAGDRLGVNLGYLARELANEIPRVLAELA